jgi:hypothetical protein
MIEYSYPTRRTNELYKMETTTVAVAANKKDMSAARRGAALKREKKIAAGLARAAGQAAAARRRSEDHTVRQRAIAEETAAIDRTIEAARHMLGVGKNEPNPTAICLMVETLTAQMRVRLSEKGFW